MSFSARRSLSIWWLELEVTPVTIDGLTVGNIEFSHKSYNPVLADSVGANLVDDLLLIALVVICIVYTYFLKDSDKLSMWPFPAGCSCSFFAPGPNFQTTVYTISGNLNKLLLYIQPVYWQKIQFL